MLPKGINPPPLPCGKCKAANWSIGKLIDRGGRLRYPIYCETCGLRSPRAAPKKEVEKLNLELKELSPWKEPNICAVCGAIGAEEHHWAPSYIFGKDAEKWPKSFLCPAHHEEWHQKVTPRMSEHTK